MSARYGMAMDTRRCVGCKACVLACNAENDIHPGHSRVWVEETVRGRFPNLTANIESKRCGQCATPTCVTVCPTGASFVAEGGVVLVDPDKCTGCKACMVGCPNGARYVHPDGHADKCTFCLHRVQRGDDPACVANCPTGALIFGDLNDPESELVELVETRLWHVDEPDSGTHPNLFYLE